MSDQDSLEYINSCKTNDPVTKPPDFAGTWEDEFVSHESFDVKAALNASEATHKTTDDSLKFIIPVLVEVALFPRAIIRTFPEGPKNIITGPWLRSVFECSRYEWDKFHEETRSSKLDSPDQIKPEKVDVQIKNIDEPHGPIKLEESDQGTSPGDVKEPTDLDEPHNQPVLSDSNQGRAKGVDVQLINVNQPHNQFVPTGRFAEFVFGCSDKKFVRDFQHLVLQSTTSEVYSIPSITSVQKTHHSRV